MGSKSSPTDWWNGQYIAVHIYYQLLRNRCCKFIVLAHHLKVLDATFDDIVPLAQTKMPEATSKSLCLTMIII